MGILTLTRKQENALYLLRLDGLRREIELQAATEAYEEAKKVEKTVQQYVVDNNEYLVTGQGNDIRGVDNGDRITDEFHMFLADEVVFINDFLPKVRAAFMKLYGIDNPLNFVYSHPMFERKMKAERHYRMLAVDFLKICGRSEEAASIENAIKGYLRPDFEKRIKEINTSFINGC
jgi:hypothetical protein